MTALTIPLASRGKIDAFKDFFHLEKGEPTIDLSGCNLINVMAEYEQYCRNTLHKHYSNVDARNKLYSLSKFVQANIMPWRVDEDFYLQFYVYCTSIAVPAMLPSSVENYCNLIRASLRWGMRHRVEVSDTFDVFEIPKIARAKVALTMDEISQIYHFDFRMWRDAQKGRKPYMMKIENYERVRDQFVLQCLLGQRYSDMKRICPAWFNEDKSIMRVPCQQKTGNQAVVNIKKLSAHPQMANEILKKYNYYAPYPHDITNSNHRLHELLQIIGAPFTTRIIHSEYEVNGEIRTEDKPLWQMIASHTGRRTFITLAVIRGHSENDVRRASGHKDVQSFIKYIINDDER